MSPAGDATTTMTSTIRNWSEYDAGLKQRGSLRFGVDEAILDAWYTPSLSGKPGASDVYSDLAIATFLNRMIQIAKPDSVWVAD